MVVVFSTMVSTPKNSVDVQYHDSPGRGISTGQYLRKLNSAVKVIFKYSL